MSAAERWVCLAALVAMCALRAVWISRRGYDTDEGQHFHVAWAWSQGRALWRDVFDNHMPLFHVLCAPLVAGVGERADALFFGRLAMVPLLLWTLLSTWTIGRRLSSPRVGWWAVAILGLQSNFLNISMEFRADDLWAAAWVASVAVLAAGPWRHRRAAFAGLLAGLAFLASIKTARLLLCLGVASVLVGAVSREARAAWRSRAMGKGVLAYGLGVFLPLGATVGAVVLSGRLEPFFRCVVRHNLAGAFDPSVGSGAIVFAGVLAVLAAACRLWLRGRDAAARAGPAVLFVASTLPIVGAWTIWPTGSNHDFLAVLPVLVPFAAAWLVRGANFLASRGSPAGGAGPSPRRAALLSAAVLVVVLAAEVSGLPFARVRRGEARETTALLADVLRLTEASDRVMDAKGETVFRDRATYPVLERITRDLLRRGVIEDRIPEDCVENHVPVAVTLLSAFPARGREFLERNYVPVGPLRVLGYVHGGPRDPGPDFEVLIVVPDEYALQWEGVPGKALLDDLPFEGPRVLAVGPHRLRVTSGEGRIAVLWARAAERGFSPFPARRAPP